MAGNYLSKRSSSAIKANYDDRKGLGYGTLDPEYHLPKMQHDTYPYVTADQHEETEDQIDDENIDQFIQKINQGYHITDFMSDRKNNPFFFVAGNTKLGEIKSMVPKPNLYKNRQVAMGGTTSGNYHIGSTFPSRAAGEISYGTKHGYASSPPPMNTGIKERPAYDINDIPPDENDVIIKLRSLISAIHDEQEEEKNES